MKIFYLESPFQLLQAAEFNRTDERQVFIIRLNGEARNDGQIKEMVDLFEISNPIFFTISNRLDTFLHLFPLFIFFIISNRIYFGDENSIIFRIFGRFFQNKLTLLDDGVATLNSSLSKKYERFTIFSTVLGHKNTLSKCRDLVRSAHALEQVDIIIGSKLVECGICSRDSYDRLLEKITLKSKSSCRRIIYIPHRGESGNNLDYIANRYALDIVSTKLPVELVGYELKVCPVNVYSVMSTALFSMSLVYDEAIMEVIPLSPDEILSRKENIGKLYSVMSEYKFLVSE